MNRFKKLITLLLSLAILVSLCNDNVIAAAKARGNNKKTAIIAPSNLNAYDITTSEIKLTWTPVSRATGYYLYGATNYNSNYRLLKVIYTNNYVHSNLEADTTYWYYVKAFNKFSTSASSVHINVKTNNLEPIPEPTPKPIPEPTPEPINNRIVLGYATYYYEGDISSYNSISNHSNTIDEIVTHTYTTDGQGNLFGLIPTNQLEAAQNNNIKVQASISNQFDGNIGKELLENAVNRKNLIDNIENEIIKYNYNGINIDLEGIYYYDRNYMTLFMEELYNQLHSKGYLVTIAVPAKTYDNPSAGWSGAYDYEKLYNYCDQIILMTYDEHYPGGTPGAIASITWVENVIKYALTVIPKEKILLGIAAYGYDWSSSGTKAYSINGIYNIINQYNATIQWDEASMTPYFTYTDSYNIEHSVWFESGESVKFKLDLVNKYDLLGTAIWRLGLENEKYWTSINSKFQ